jgi:hypothetical protein
LYLSLEVHFTFGANVPLIWLLLMSVAVLSRFTAGVGIAYMPMRRFTYHAAVSNYACGFIGGLLLLYQAFVSQ